MALPTRQRLVRSLAALGAGIAGLALCNAPDAHATPGACGYVTYNTDGTPQDVPYVPPCAPPCQGIGQGPGHVGNTTPRVDFFVCVTGL